MKRRKHVNLILGLCCLMLVAVCVAGVMGPVRFAKERARREQAVKAALVHIRDAQERYRHRHGAYCASLDRLVSGGYLVSGGQYVPGTPKRRFRLSVGLLPDRSGRGVPVMECGATYAVYLQGLDAHEIDRLTDEAEARGEYPGLKIGDIITDNNNAGNWE